jgi:hypothetical protein
MRGSTRPCRTARDIRRMPVMPRPTALLIAAVLVLAPPVVDAKRHGRGHGHHGWMHARIAAVRGWFRHVAREAPTTSNGRARRRDRSASARAAAEQAALTSRRRGEVEAYLRDHPALAMD